MQLYYKGYRDSVDMLTDGDEVFREASNEMVLKAALEIQLEMMGAIDQLREDVNDVERDVRGKMNNDFVGGGGIVG